MTGHRPFSELTKDWPPERRRRVEEGTARLSAEVEAALADERAAKRERRDTAGYQFKEGNKVVHVGITNDPKLREAERERRQTKDGKPTTGYRE